MGFLDKLLGSAASEVINKIKEAAAAPSNAPSPSQASRPSSAPVSSAPTDATSGDSWGPTMPDEENQYNYNGTYDQYFYAVFTENFPQYRITCESVRKGSATVITFWKDTQEKALIVELLSENSSAEAIRYHSKKAHIPYLRFYYNHHGWWNTKSYVIRRAKEALQ